MTDNKMERLYLSQCASKEWCEGYNSAVEKANEIIDFLNHEIEHREAEIERLEKEVKEKTEWVGFLKKQVIDWKDDYCKLKESFETIKSDTINAFVERLKDEIKDTRFAYEAEEQCECIDNIVKEMVGED